MDAQLLPGKHTSVGRSKRSGDAGKVSQNWQHIKSQKYTEASYYLFRTQMRLIGGMKYLYRLYSGFEFLLNPFGKNRIKQILVWIWSHTVRDDDLLLGFPGNWRVQAGHRKAILEQGSPWPQRTPEPRHRALGCLQFQGSLWWTLWTKTKGTLEPQLQELIISLYFYPSLSRAALTFQKTFSKKYVKILFPWGWPSNMAQS